MEFALRRVLARSRRRRPRPPQWWLALFWIVWCTAFGAFDVVAGEWLYAASMLSWLALWWRAIHSPPHYWNWQAFVACFPLGVALFVAGLLS